MSISIRPKAELTIAGHSQDDQTFEYWVTGSNDYAEIMLTLEISLDQRFNFFHVLRKIDLKQQAKGIWIATASYVRPKPGDPEYAQTQNFPPIHFELSGVQQHLTQSLQTISSHGVSGADPPPNYQGAVNVSDKKVEGYDFDFPEFTWTEKYFLKKDVAFSNAYVKAMRKAFNRLNKKKWRDFDAKSVRFKGATGGSSDKFPDYAEITFKFESAEALKNQSYGAITGVDKGPFELIWIVYDATEDTAAKKMIKTPKYVYVERIFEQIEFSTLRMPL